MVRPKPDRQSRLCDFRGGNRITTEGCNRGSSTGRANRFLFKLYSNLFIVPKKDGGQRPVISLKVLNNFVNKGIYTLKDLLKRKDWLAKIMPSFQYPSTPTTKNFSGSCSKGRPTNSISYPSAYPQPHGCSKKL